MLIREVVLSEGYKEARNKYISKGNSTHMVDLVLDSFKQLVNKNQIKELDKKNIDWWAKNKSLHELMYFVGKLSAKDTPTQLKRNKKPGKYITLVDNEEWLIVIPLDKDASCFHGKNTNWCTAKRKDDYFENYFYGKKFTLLYCINKQTDEKFAIVGNIYDGIEIFDERDNYMPISDFKDETKLNPSELLKNAFFNYDDEIDDARHAIEKSLGHSNEQ